MPSKKQHLWQERASSARAADKGGSHSTYDPTDGVRESGTLAGEDVAAAAGLAGLDAGGATTTFEERTVWNLTDVSFYVCTSSLLFLFCW